MWGRPGGLPGDPCAVSDKGGHPPGKVKAVILSIRTHHKIKSSESSILITPFRSMCCSVFFGKKK